MILSVIAPGDTNFSDATTSLVEVNPSSIVWHSQNIKDITVLLNFFETWQPWLKTEVWHLTSPTWWPYFTATRYQAPAGSGAEVQYHSRKEPPKCTEAPQTASSIGHWYHHIITSHGENGSRHQWPLCPRNNTKIRLYNTENSDIIMLRFLMSWRPAL